MKLAWRDLVALKPAPIPLLDSVRLTAPAVVALVGLAAAGRFVLGLVAALGAYIVLFGAGQSGRRRAKVYVSRPSGSCCPWASAYSRRGRSC
ncbi:MAG TPA: hypothetical protein VF304_09850 [Casimicrobiaceae bacterium]